MNYSRLYAGYHSVKDQIFGESKAYVFFRLSDIAKTYDESAGNMPASSIDSGTVAIIGFCGLAIGAILGAACTAFVYKGKKKKKNG